MAAFVPGDLVFAIDTEQARRFWFLKYVIDIFPVDPTNPMAIRAMVKAVREGRRLAIFPEGRITVTGALMKIYDGPGMIADKADAAIIPVRIDGLQFHKTSRMQGKLPLRWFPRREPDGVAAGVPRRAGGIEGPDAARGTGPHHAGHHDRCRVPPGTPAAQPVRRAAGGAPALRHEAAGRRRYRSERNRWDHPDGD